MNPTMFLRLARALGVSRVVRLLLVLLPGCASVPEGPPASAWIPDAAWWTAASRSGGEFAGRDGALKQVDALHAKNLYEVAEAIRRESGIAALIALADVDELNAYAAVIRRERVITLTLPLLAAIGDDRDALATTLGHEAAHLYYAHAAARASRNLPAQGITYVMGGLPGTGPSAGSGMGEVAIVTAFSRYEEREADLKGLEWAVDAGFSPCGSARTFRILAWRQYTEAADGYNRTHPGHEERIARANSLARKLTGRRC